MKKLPALLILSLAAAFLTLAPACADGGGDGDGDGDGDHPALELTGDAASGDTLFGANCASCHGADGTGGSGPDLTPLVPELSDNDIAFTIQDGKGSMPGFDLEDQEIADVLAFLRDTFGG